MTDNAINYRATRVAADFHADNSYVRLLLGAVGTGKTVCCCIEILRRAMEQEADAQKIRRTRWAVVRNTYPELKSTTIKTWQNWIVPDLFGSPKWSSPITHFLDFKAPDGTTVQAEIIFLSLDGNADIGKLMSLELTGIYYNELQFISKYVFDAALTRLNRYPPATYDVPITWTGIIADTNPPDTEHWIYKTFVNDHPEGYKYFQYDPAIIRTDNPIEAKRSISGTYYKNNENADFVRVHKDPGYWLKMVPSYTDEQIKVYLQGDWGVFIDGRPVHPEYSDQFHFSTQPLQYNPNCELGLGWDFGLTPACAVVQFIPGGQLVVLAELFDDKMCLRDFAEIIVIPWLDKNCNGWRNDYISRHDPAGQTASQTDGQTCQDILSQCGITSWPAADNNSPTARRDGLKTFLRRLTGGKPGFLLNNSISRLRKGLIGSFHYQRLRSSTSEHYHDKPAKNLYSHICEALEYIAMHYSNPVSIHKNDEHAAVIELLEHNARQTFFSL